MIGRLGVLLSVLALASCRGYDLLPHLSSDAGLVPGDQYARYGKEQAEAVAIARRMAESHHGGSPEERARHLDSATAYARSLPDVADVTADPAGHRLTVEFRSGWRVGVVPLADGKAPGQTPGIGAPAAR